MQRVKSSQQPTSWCGTWRIWGCCGWEGTWLPCRQWVASCGDCCVRQGPGLESSAWPPDSRSHLSVVSGRGPSGGWSVDWIMDDMLWLFVLRLVLLNSTDLNFRRYLCSFPITWAPLTLGENYPLFWVLVTIGKYKKNTPFPGFLGISSRDYAPKIPPFLRKWENACGPL